MGSSGSKNKSKRFDFHSHMERKERRSEISRYSEECKRLSYVEWEKKAQKQTNITLSMQSQTLLVMLKAAIERGTEGFVWFRTRIPRGTGQHVIGKLYDLSGLSKEEAPLFIRETSDSSGEYAYSYVCVLDPGAKRLWGGGSPQKWPLMNAADEPREAIVTDLVLEI